MTLSIVIVNYNVKYFLEQALQSVFQSQVDFEYEVFVSDNHSVDGSIEMVKHQYPAVKLIENNENLGFAKGNNVAINKASGKYILLLNPDTIVKEDTFQKVVNFMEAHDDAGALGVKMMDGKGHFLPESKRGFPTPFVAFYKMSGLSKLFPKSKTFNRYHQGHLDKNQIHEVDVLSGAFMLLRKSVIDQIGSLDEAFFMYGEDIDLSYRIKQAGFKNYYFPETEIIHFKGESTKKGSYNYVRMFYNAMIIFARKHFKGSKATYLTSLLQLAIYARASIALFRRVFEKFGWPVFDAATIYVSMIGIQSIWSQVVKEGVNYPESLFYFNIPLYVGMWLLTFFFRGGYDEPSKVKKIPVSIGIGTIVILAIYALLPLYLRSSRGMILTGAATVIVVMVLARLIYHLLNGSFKSLFQTSNKVLIVASQKESDRISNIINNAATEKEVIGIANDLNEDHHINYLGRLSDIEEISKIQGIDEIIFSKKDINNQTIMRVMSALGGKVEYKIISEGSDVIIGSHSKNSAGDLYTLDINFNLNQTNYRRSKRLTDLISVIIILILSPILLLIVKQKIGFFRNIFAVLIGHKTWIGYGEEAGNLPALKSSVISIANKFNHQQLIAISNLNYAKNYHWTTDIKAIFQNVPLLGD